MQTQDERSVDWGITILFPILMIVLLAWQLMGTGLAAGLLELTPANELYLFLMAKGGDVIVILLLILLFRKSAQSGFRLPLNLGTMIYGLPILLLSAFLIIPIVQRGLTIPPGMVIGWTVVALFVGLSEETVFRGVLYRVMEPLGVWVNAIVTSVAFGAIHLLGLLAGLPKDLVIAQSFMAGSIGLVLFVVRRAEGSIWTAILLHWLIDAVAFVSFGGVTKLAVASAGAVHLAHTISITMLAWGIPALITQNKRRRNVHPVA